LWWAEVLQFIARAYDMIPDFLEEAWKFTIDMIVEEFP
jgi:hypothetical protein